VLIAQLFEAVKQVNLLKEGQLKLTEADVQLLSHTLNTFTFDVLGLRDESKIDAGHFEKLSGVIELLIDQRNKARERRDFAASDEIRDQLLELGIQLKDSKDGTTFSLS
jgi:cysteinyl-tRNA synthetase